MTDPLLQMRIFGRVAALQSFSKAALELGLPKTTVSEAIQKLEARQGVRLLQRTTRSVQLTHDGQIFWQRSQQLIEDADELTELFKSDAAISGVLRVDMPVAFARQAVIPQLPSFLNAYPALRVQLSCTDRRVDLINEGFDAVIRIGTLQDSSLVARKLGELPQINVASASYIATFGMPLTLADLSQHQLVHYSQGLAEHASGFCYQDAGGSREIAMNGRLTVNNTEAYRQACMAGLGIIQAPRQGLQELIEQGVLVEVLPDYRPAALPIHMLYPHRRGVSRRLRLFMDFLTKVLTAPAQA